MRVGVVGLIPSDLTQVDAGAIAHVRSLGFQGVSVVVGQPGTVGPAVLRRVSQTVVDGGLTVAQINGQYPSLVSADPALRRAGIAGLVAHMASARFLHAETLYVRPGGLNPGGPWWPHPAHHGQEAFDRLVESLRAVARAAEGEGVTLALEAHAVSVLDTPERYGAAVRAVGSPALRVNLDPVNLIGSIWDAWRPQPVFDRLLGQTAPHIVSAHWKDYTVEDRHVVHIAEVPLGQGVIDHARWLGQLHAVQPATWVLIEHLPPERIPAAKAALDLALRQAGLRWDDRR
ncbi:MAG: sugar phosphate isomerase/epimerase [Actinobacteria bacterium]|nr:sugar phosphate isomerase/epimerase [Actinomycetota bacterium]